MNKNLVRWLQDCWYREMYLSTWIMPVSMIYLDVIRLRRFLYRKGILNSTRLPVPVIIVGNITVGGTGKTPLVIWMSRFLLERGFKPGVISRGYAGKSQKQAVTVHPDSRPEVVGDEPLLLARHCRCPVVICSDRVSAARRILRDQNCNVIISDDGLQHYALQRDIEIAVIDGRRRFGNGYCLPAGPLREPVERLGEVDLQIVNGPAVEPGEYEMAYRAGHAVHLATGKTAPLQKFAAQPVHALAGIGNPDSFFSLLEVAGIQVIPHAFPDHYPFSARDIDFSDQKTVLMTEKDAVKCLPYARDPHWYVPIYAEPQTQFAERLLKLLEEKTRG